MAGVLTLATLIAFVTVNVIAPAAWAVFDVRGDPPLITDNMQGSTSGQDGKWVTTINGYAERTGVVGLQEAGPTPPRSAVALANIPVPAPPSGLRQPPE